MAYSVKNVIVGAAALFVTKSDSVTNAAVVRVAPNVAVTSWFADGIASGPDLPVLTGGAAAALEAGASFRNVGFTDGGIEVSYEPDFGDVMVDQLLDSARIFKQGMKVSVKTTLSEATLSNLLFSWGIKEDASATTNTGNVTVDISGGALGDEPVERGLAFVGPAPRDSTGARRERVYHVRRALQVESSAHSLARSDATTIPVSFRCLPDAVTSGSSYGKITDRLLT